MPLPIHLDGTTLEGGGQLLRLATCLSSLTRIPIQITSIRGKRSGGGGLKSQHLTSVQWLGAACNANLSGAELKSRDLSFFPRKNGDAISEQWISGSDITIVQTTPGSVNLVFQAVLPFVLFGRGGKGTELKDERGDHKDEKSTFRLTITGGTNVSNSPSCDYIDQVLLPMLALIGLPPITMELRSRGWSLGNNNLGTVTYSGIRLGGSKIRSTLPGFQLTDRGEVRNVRATILAPKTWESLFRDELDVMFERMEGKLFGNQTPDVEITFEDSCNDKRAYLLMVATTTTGIKLGRDWLYDKGIKPGKASLAVQNMVKKVAGDLVSEIEHGGCVDEYMRDQLVVFQALAEGTSKVFGGQRNGKPLKPSLHARTAHWVAKQLIGVEFGEDGGCDGIAFSPAD